MVRKAVAALTGLGLIGGAGSVAYDQHGGATVRIKDQAGHVQTVQIASASGQGYSCPAGTHDRLEPLDIRAGRIKLTLQGVRRKEHALEAKYPTHKAPHAIVLKYNALLRRDNLLVDAYNATIDEHNQVLARDCTANSGGS